MRSEGDQSSRTSSAATTAISVASALAGTGAGGGDLIKKLLPILAPIVLAYIGKQFTQGQCRTGRPAAAGPGRAGGGGLGDVLGSILGGARAVAAGNNPLGSILGSVLGGQQGGAIGDILGGLLGRQEVGPVRASGEGPARSACRGLSRLLGVPS